MPAEIFKQFIVSRESGSIWKIKGTAGPNDNGRKKKPLKYNFEKPRDESIPTGHRDAAAP